MNANYKSIILAISLLFALSASISAAPGDLDSTFGNGGIVITRGSTFNGLDQARGMAIQSDGKIVVVGDGATSNTWDFAVVRYNTNGSLDSSFGDTGIVLTPVGNSHDAATSVAIQADGKIVVAGSSCNGVGDCSSAGSSLAVVRYNTDGTLDTSFNGTGKVINSDSSASDLAIQADGKIVVAGWSALFRYNTDGTLDTSFNGTGIVITERGVAHSVAIQSDGKIVAAGGNQNSFAVARYNTDGSVDNSFNGTGMVITSVSNSDSGAEELAIQADGKIVVAGGSALFRYNTDGTLDTSFNGTGKVINSAGSASDLAIQADGKIVVAGNSAIGDLGRNFVIVRFNPNGSLDTTFNGTGKVITPFCCQSYAIAVAIQADGKIVVAGGTDDIAYDYYDFVVVRYQGDGGSATDPAACPNPIDCADFFVRQHYRDFLNREPEPQGLQDWLQILQNCAPGDTRCDRIEVSSAFFRSPEFRERGYFPYRFYNVALGRKPNYAEFIPDLARVSGFLTEAEKEQARQAFVAEFMARAEFVNIYGGLTNNAYVQRLFDTAGVTQVTVSGSAQTVQSMQQQMAAGKTRAQVLREMVESPEVDAKFYVQAFVVMQYFGYLRRDPDALYLNWITTMQADPSNYRQMVNGFMNSPEYRSRFGQ